MSLKRIYDLRDKIKAYNTDMFKLIRISIVDNEAFIVNLNTEDQLAQEGINAKSVKISDYKPYTEFTIEIKKLKNQRTDIVTLHDTGDFAASFYIEADGNAFEIKATDVKTDKLIKKYGRNILGLTDENIYEVIWAYVYPYLRLELNKYIK